jgi:HEPN domain-containing protein
MPDIKHARLLLSIARRDLQASSHMLNPSDFPEEAFGFHAQQAVEKALKAWVCLKGVTYPWEHDLEQLFQLLEDAGEKGATEFRDLVGLTDFAARLRYDYSDDEPLDREETLRRVAAIVALVAGEIDRVDPGQ